VGAASGKKAECSAYSAARRIGRTSSARIGSIDEKCRSQDLTAPCPSRFLRPMDEQEAKAAVHQDLYDVFVQRRSRAELVMNRAGGGVEGTGYMHRTSHEADGIALR